MFSVLFTVCTLMHTEFLERDQGGGVMQPEEGYDGRFFAIPSIVTFQNRYKHIVLYMYFV